jgi:hypothetical protein
MSDRDSSFDRAKSESFSIAQPYPDTNSSIPLVEVTPPIRSLVRSFHNLGQYLQFLQGSLSSHILPISISTETSHFGRKTRDTSDRPDFLKAILAFFQIQGIPITPLDLLSLQKTRDILSPEQYHHLIDSFSWRSYPSPHSIFSTLRLASSCGRKSNIRIWSYTKVDFPLGLPLTSGRRSDDRNCLNDFWVACEYQCDDSRKRTCSIVSQVNSGLEHIENEQAALDVMINRNRNVLRHFLTYGNQPGFPSQIIQQEFVSIYGVNGPLVLELLLVKAVIVLPRILERLRERYRTLCIQKLKGQSRSAVEIGRLLPRQCAKYQPIPGPRDDVAEFSILGLYPASYRTEDTRFLVELFDLLVEVAWKHQSSFLIQFQSCILCVKDIVGDLRSQRFFNKASPYAMALFVCATLIGKLKICVVLDATAQSSLEIPLAIGLTHPALHGHYRLLRIAAESIVTRRWGDGVTEISGMFPNIELFQAAVLLRTFDLTWKCVANAVAAPVDLPEGITINVAAGIVTIARREDPTRPFSIDLTQYSQW